MLSRNLSIHYVVSFFCLLMYSFLSRLRLAEESVVGVVDGGINFCRFFFLLSSFCDKALAGETLRSADFLLDLL